jgi:rfaE bifunctional protein kinase chain/domain
MEASIPQIVESFRSLKVLVIGDVMLDSYIWGAVERISPEAPVPVVSVKKKDYRLGGAANVALNVRALGATPVLCALIGDDEDGKKLIQRLSENGIGKEGMVVSKDRPTTVKTRVIASAQHVVRVDEESDEEANETEQRALLQRIETLLPSCQVVIFEDYDKGVLSPAIIETALGLAKKHNIPTVVDPKKRNFLRYRNATLFKPNLKELREGLKMDVAPDSLPEVEQAVALLKENLGVQGVLVTLSAHGVYINHANQKVKLPAHTRTIADVSGAGDTVVSIAALGVALNLSPKLIASLANLGGGLVCQYTGVVPIDKDEFLAEAAHLA